MGSKELMLIDIIKLLKAGFTEEKILQLLEKQNEAKYFFSKQEEIHLKALGLSSSFILKIKVINNQIAKKYQNNILKLRALRVKKNSYDPNIDEEGNVLKTSDKIMRGVFKFLLENVNPEKALIRGLN